MLLKQARLTFLVGILLLVAGVSEADAQLCWNCRMEGGVGRCVGTYVPQEGHHWCQETGYGPCLMGSPCGPTLPSIQAITPDGTLEANDALAVLRTPNAIWADLGGAAYARSCGGGIVARAYSPSRAALLRAKSVTITLE